VEEKANRGGEGDASVTIIINAGKRG